MAKQTACSPSIAPTIQFSPAIPMPSVFDVPKRIQELHSYLDPKNPRYQPEGQHANIKAAIKLYEDGKIDGYQRVFIMEGKLVTREQMFKGTTWSWGELNYRADYISLLRSVPKALNLALLSLTTQYQLRILLRLMPHRGGDGTVHGIIAMNDTGSDVPSLFDTDLPYLGGLQGYTGWNGWSMILSANGAVELYPTILVQVQLVQYDGSPWSDWIDEEAIIKPIRFDVPRLSGMGIRMVLFLGTGPGNDFLAVSTSKGGLNSLL